MSSEEECQERLQDLMKLKGNDVCADCAEPSPTWASTNIGVFICTQCAGVHRSLGVEHSFVLSCTLDIWIEEQVSFMQDNGNIKINSIYEYSVPKNIEVPCGSTTDRDTREAYIKAKYVNKLFHPVDGRSPRPPERVPRKGSMRASPVPQGLTSMVEYIGIVNVLVVECRDLVVKDITSSDPYCIVGIGTQTHRTKVVYKSLFPKYDESFTFSWDGCDKLVIDVFDKDEITKDDHMGKCEVDLSPLLSKADFVMDNWFQIRHRKKEEKLQGEIHLVISFMKIT